MEPRSALPWVLSTIFHAALITALSVSVFIPSRDDRETGVVLSILPFADSFPDTFAGVVAPRGGAAASTRSGPAGRTIAPAPRVSADSAAGVTPSEGESLEAAVVTLPRSTAEEAPAEPATDAPVMDLNEPAVEQQVRDAQIGWEGSPRKLLSRRDPLFPALLSAVGQEVECEARILVSPSGAVTRVEITRSSGYIEIDASVEAALRDYLFSRANERKDAVGTIRFRFRLERQY
jgi:TonB family protein